MSVIIQIDKEKPIEFGFKNDAVEYLENIRASGRYYYKIYTKEYELETTFLKHLSSVCEEIMKSAATMEGVLIDIKLGKNGEMTLIQKIVCKLEMEGLIKENETKGENIIHRLTKKGLSFYNDYKSMAGFRNRSKGKKFTDFRNKKRIYNIR